MSENGPEDEGPRAWAVTPEQANAMIAALEGSAGTRVPTTFDFRKMTMELLVVMGGHGSLKFKSVDDLIKQARKLEAFLRENND